MMLPIPRKQSRPEDCGMRADKETQSSPATGEGQEKGMPCIFHILWLSVSALQFFDFLQKGRREVCNQALDVTDLM